MQCKAFCTADSYQIDQLYKYLKKNEISTQKLKNVIYASFKEGHIYFFSYGCVIFWALDDHDINHFLKKLKNFETGPLAQGDSEFYRLVASDQTSVHQSEISLSENAGIFERLAISYALAQSTKLSTFEARVDQTIRNTDHIPKSLALTGKIHLSGKEIAQKMGELFLERSSINLQNDILGTPDFFWEYPELEPIYNIAANEQDLKQRTDILNKRLRLIHELFEILSNVFNSRHSSILEIIIIILIAVEIILTILFHMLR